MQEDNRISLSHVDVGHICVEYRNVLSIGSIFSRNNWMRHAGIPPQTSLHVRCLLPFQLREQASQLDSHTRILAFVEGVSSRFSDMVNCPRRIGTRHHEVAASNSWR